MRYTNQRIRFVDDHEDMHQISPMTEKSAMRWWIVNPEGLASYLKIELKVLENSGATG